MRILITVHCLLLSPVTPPQTHAQDKPEQRSVEVELYGSQRILCRSRWHDIRMDCQLKGHLKVDSATIANLLPTKPLQEGEQWRVGTKAANAFAAEIRNTLTVSAIDTQKYQEWKGSNPTPNPTEFDCRLLATVQSTSERKTVIRYSGTWAWQESGKLASRFGPNWWKESWLLKPTMMVTINTETNRISSFKIVRADGTVEGQYHNNGHGDLKEPFTCIVSLRGEQIEPLTELQIAELRTHIKNLDSDRFVIRQNASQAIQELGISARDEIRKAMPNCSPESKARLRKILAIYGQ